MVERCSLGRHLAQGYSSDLLPNTGLFANQQQVFQVEQCMTKAMELKQKSMGKLTIASPIFKGPAKALASMPWPARISTLYFRFAAGIKAFGGKVAEIISVVVFDESTVTPPKSTVIMLSRLKASSALENYDDFSRHKPVFHGR